MPKPIDLDAIEKLLTQKATKGELYPPEETAARFDAVLRSMVDARDSDTHR